MPKKPVGHRGQNHVGPGNKPSRSMADVLALPDIPRLLVQWILRQEAVELKDVMTYMDTDERASRDLLETLVEQGFLQMSDTSARRTYQVRLSARRGRQSSQNLWQTLGKRLEE